MTIDEARAAIGQTVVYRRKGREPDEGVITSVSDRYVFVRYGAGRNSAATNPADLELATS